MPLPRHERYAYSAIADRPDFTWPGGKRMAVYVGLNVECFSFGSGLGAQLSAGPQEPDVLNYAWRDYGNRVGIWRILALMNDLKLPVTALVNSALYEETPGLIEALRARGDEIAAHGRSNSERQGGLDEAAERELIAEATRIITTREGKPPKGWLSPWISESATTPDLLAEAGYEYLLDWCQDDQPVWMKTRSGRILSLPYPQELNDMPQIVGRKCEAKEFADMIIDGYETLRSESAHRPVVMGIALHPFIMGQPHRIGHLARALDHVANSGRSGLWWTTAGAINDHWRGLEQ